MSDTPANGGNSATAPVADVPQATVPPPGLTTDKTPAQAMADHAAALAGKAPGDTPAADAKAPADGKTADPAKLGESLASGGDPTKDGDKADPAKPDAKAEDYKPIAATDLKLPEGLAAEDPILKAALEGATDAKISKEALQPLIDKVAPQLKELQEAPLREWAAKQKEWVTQVKADPEIGGAALDKTVLPGIAKLLDQSGVGKEAREALDFTGAGNNPAIVKLLHFAAQKLSEGTPVRGNPAAMTRDVASILYPTHSKANGAGR